MPISEETKKKISLALTGRALSPEHKLNLSIAKKGCKQPNRKSPPPFSKTHKRKISETMKGKQNSLGVVRDEAYKKKVSENQTGRKRSRETREKIGKAKYGPKNPMWKGGIEKDRAYCNSRSLVAWHRRRTIMNKNGGLFTLKEWDDLKKRYNYTCPQCSKKEPNIKLTVDHIIPVSKGGDNLITNIQPLCGYCNSSKSNRESEAICKQLYL